jgi:hypothetical protein
MSLKLSLNMSSSSNNRSRCVATSHQTNPLDRIETVGPLTFEFKRKSQIDDRTSFDTTRRYHHINGYRSYYKNNRVWTNNNGVGKRVFTSGTTFQFRSQATYNPQVAGVHGPKLKSNPLPPFVPMTRKAEPTKFAMDLPCEQNESAHEFAAGGFWDDTPEPLQDENQLPLYAQYLRDDVLRDLVGEPTIVTPNQRFAQMYNPFDTDNEADSEQSFRSTRESAQSPTTEPQPDPKPSCSYTVTEPQLLDSILPVCSHDNPFTTDDDSEPFPFVPNIPTIPRSQLEPSPTFLNSIFPTKYNATDLQNSRSLNSELLRLVQTYETASSDALKMSILDAVSERSLEFRNDFVRLTSLSMSHIKHLHSLVQMNSIVPVPPLQPRLPPVLPPTPISSDDSSDEESGNWKKLINMPSTITRAANKITKSFSSAANFMPSIKESMTSTNNKIDAVTTKANSILQSVEDLLKPLSAHYATALDFVALSGHFINLLYDAYNYESYGMTMLIFKTAFSFSSIVRILFPHIQAYNKDTIEREAQGLSSNMTSINNFLLQFTGNKLLLETGKTFQSFNQIKNGLTSVRAFSDWIFQHLPTFLQDLIAAWFPSDTILKTRYVRFMNNVATSLHLMEESLPIPIDVADLIHSDSLFLSQFFSMPSKDNIHLCNAFMRAKISGTRAYAYAHAYVKHRTPRQCPYSIVFHGETRIGKTVMMQKLAHDMAFIHSHKGQISYVRQPGTPHWDGFSDDIFCTIYDDWLQNTEFNDVTEMFSLLTKQHFIVPMASLDNPLVGIKGTLNLSKIVLAATNADNKQVVATKILSPDALFARIVTRVKVTKMPLIDYDPVNYSHLRFNVITIENGNDIYSQHTMNYDTFLVYACEQYEKHYKNQDAIDKEPLAPPSNLETLRARFGKSITKEAQGVSDFFKPPGLLNSTPLLRTALTFSLATQSLYSAWKSVDQIFALNKIDDPTMCWSKFPTRHVVVALGAALSAASIWKLLKPENIITYADRIRPAVDLARYLVTREADLPSTLIRAETLTNPSQTLTSTLQYLETLPANDPDKSKVNAFLLTMKTRLAESRTMNDKTKKTSAIRGESRTMPNKAPLRPTIRGEAEFDIPVMPDPTTHSKFNTPHYNMNHRMDQDYNQYVHHPPDKQFIDRIFEAQGLHDPDALLKINAITDRVVPVTLSSISYEKHYTGVTSVHNYVNAIPVSQNHFLLPRHFFHDKTGDVIQSTPTNIWNLSFLIKGKNHHMQFDPSRLRFLLDSAGKPTLDAATYDIGKTDVTLLRSCRTLFVSERQLPLIKDGSATMIGYSLVEGKPIFFHNSFSYITQRRAIEYNIPGGRTMSVLSGITYQAPTRSGDCGSPIVVHNPQIEGKILGFHLWGDTHGLESGGMIITAEMLERNLEISSETKIIPHEVTFTITPRSQLINNYAQHLSIEIIGEVDRPIHINRSTSFTPTPLLNHFEAYTNYPCDKHASEGHDPLTTATLLFGSDCYTVSEQFTQPALNYLQRKYKNQPARVYTAYEAMNKQNAMERINLNTSAGYPYVLRGQSKMTFCQCDELTGEVSWKSETFGQYVQQYCDSWLDSLHEVIWITSLKDCLEKPGKLTRLFEIPPLEYTIACRAYFGAWISMMHGSVGEHFCSVGISPESKQWSEMTYKLLSLSCVGLDADAPNWDKNLMSRLVFMACESVNAWYKKNDPSWTPKQDNARINLIYAMLHSYMISGWLFLRKWKGMPSGHVLTALFNSVTNMIMHLIWFLTSVPLRICDQSFYDDCIVTFVYGDDAIDSILPTLLEYLNRNTMQTAYQRYCSMSITSAKKDSTLQPYDNVMDLTYLKRGFRKDGVFYKPLLSKKSLFSMLCFVRESKHVTAFEQLCSNFRQFSAFAYFYGPEFYNQTTAYLTKLFPTYSFPDYSYYNNMYLFGQYELTFDLQ